MKDKRIIIVILVLIGIIFYIYLRNQNQINVKDITIVYSVNEENKDVIKNKFDSKESFLLVIGFSSCSHCIHYKDTTLTYYINNNPEFGLLFMYFDNQFNNNTEFLEYLQQFGVLEYKGSPTTYLVKNGVVEGISEGDMSLNSLYKFIKRNE